MHKYDENYRSVTSLKGGLEVFVRLIRADDKERLRQGFDGLSPQTRYLRFFATKSQLNAHELDYLTQVDQENHVALVAGLIDAQGEERGLGVARFVRLDDRRDCAEAAITVVDEYRRYGIGALLLTELVAAAVERGVKWFTCDFLAENAAVESLLRTMAPGFEVTSLGSGVTRGLLPISPPPKPEARQPSDHKQLLRFLSHAAEGLISIQTQLRTLKHSSPTSPQDEAE